MMPQPFFERFFSLALTMLRRSNFRRVAAISIFFSFVVLAPAMAGDCRIDSCGSGYVVQQAPDVDTHASTDAASVVAQYCDGYGGGQNPYANCSVRHTEYIAPVSPPPLAAAKAPASPPGPLPIVTKYSADNDGAPSPPPAVGAKAAAPSSGELPIVTKYKPDAH